MNHDKFATAFAAAQLYMARVKQNDHAPEVNIKQLDEQLTNLFEELSDIMQERIMAAAALFKVPNDQPPVRTVGHG